MVINGGYAMNKRIIIGVAVCVVYSLIDVFTNILRTIGSSICSMGCGCDTTSMQSYNTVSSSGYYTF